MPFRKLKALRAEHGLTQPEMAQRLNMTEATYRNRENGKTEFVVSEINRILKEFDVKYEDIFLD